MNCKRCGVHFDDTEHNYIEIIEFDEGNEGETDRFCGYQCIYRWYFH